METSAGSEPNFDPNLALTLLFELGRERSVQGLMGKLTTAVVARPSAVARAEVWLIEKGDICSQCPQRAECPDQTRCLHLTASRNNPMPGGPQGACSHYRFDTRLPLGVGMIGTIATSGQQVRLTGLEQEPRNVFPVQWLRAEQIRGFHGTPITFQGEVLGVMAAFGRVSAMDQAGAWPEVIAQHIGGAIANARAFEEIQRLKAQLEVQNAYLQEEVVEAKAFGELVGQSSALRHLVSQIDLVASTEASVLIGGETGTGKELVAYEIHNRSRREEKPLVRVNCASIPKDLFESEFFGHARGAFTGAIRDRVGRFEAADGGTLFLDEIGEVPLDLQSKPLRVSAGKALRTRRR